MKQIIPIAVFDVFQVVGGSRGQVTPSHSGGLYSKGIAELILLDAFNVYCFTLTTHLDSIKSTKERVFSFITKFFIHLVIFTS